MTAISATGEPMLGEKHDSQVAAAAFMVAGSVWFAVGAIYGMFSAMHLTAPEIFNNIPWLVFGRTRPVHVNTMLYGFVASTLIGCALYYIPALLHTRLWSQKLGIAACVCWQLAVLSGPITFAFARTQGREYAEYIYPADVLVMLALACLIINAVMTIANRRRDPLYVSVWYAVGAIIWTSCVYPIGNVMWRPDSGAMPGLIDSIFLWFFGHNIVGLLLTPLAVGATFFVFPRVVQKPIYSHTLSLIGFWSLIALYAHIGGHHLLQAPIPNWLKTLSVVDSMAMVIPVATVLANLWLTVRGSLDKLWSDLPGRFVMMGTIWYLITCIQGPIQSLPSVQKLTHFNNWVIGHAHIAVLGFSGFIALGAMYHVLPLAIGKKIYSWRLMSVQFALVLFGLTGFFVVLTAAGLIQGGGWYNGEMVYRILPEIAPYMVLRAGLGVTIMTGAFIGLYNVIMTLRRGERLPPEEPKGPEAAQ